MTKEDSEIREALRIAFDEITAYYDELNGESPRAAAILAVSALEDELDAIIRSQFPRSTSNTKWKLVAGPGPTPFGTTKAKTDVAHVFGFFGSETRTTIQLSARVRNKFAHRTNIRDFSHPDVLCLCRKLADNPVLKYSLIDNPSPEDVRWNFINLVKELTERLAGTREYIPELDDTPPKPLP
jgi:hypothetical protein